MRIPNVRANPETCKHPQSSPSFILYCQSRSTVTSAQRRWTERGDGGTGNTINMQPGGHTSRPSTCSIGHPQHNNACDAAGTSQSWGKELAHSTDSLSSNTQRQQSRRKQPDMNRLVDHSCVVDCSQTLRLLAVHLEAKNQDAAPAEGRHSWDCCQRLELQRL